MWECEQVRWAGGCVTVCWCGGSPAGSGTRAQTVSSVANGAATEPPGGALTHTVETKQTHSSFHKDERVRCSLRLWMCE